MLDITVSAVPLTGWTALRVERLTELWAKGFSATQIANDLGGLTRSAVLGKLHRMGKPKVRPLTIAKPKRGPNRIPRPKKAKVLPLTRAEKAERQIDARMARLFGPIWNNAPAVAPAAMPGQSCSLMQLTPTMCRFPSGDPATSDFHFCGAAKPFGTPYCQFHHRIAYQPIAPPKFSNNFVAWGGR